MDIPKILIVDDEEEAKSDLRRILRRKLKCDIQEAGNGREALEILKKQSFDIILLDVKMPGISGVDVLKSVKKTHPQTDILIISAYDSPQIASQVFKDGAADYVIKPFRAEVMRSKINALLEKRNKYPSK